MPIARIDLCLLRLAALCGVFLLFWFHGGCTAPCAGTINELGEQMRAIVHRAENQACEDFTDCVLISPSFSCWQPCSVAVNKEHKEEIEAQIAALESLCTGRVCSAATSCPGQCATVPHSGIDVCTRNAFDFTPEETGTCQAGTGGDYCVVCQEQRCTILEFPFTYPEEAGPGPS